MSKINKIAVIGSGVMGSGIAAHIANAGYSVMLFDIVLDDKDDRTYLAKNAIEQMLNNPIKPLMSNSLVNKIDPCNLEDDLDKLSDVDLIIEAIAEKIELKTALYEKLIKYTKPSCIFGSNTSTIPLLKLTEKFDREFKKRFLITHFFNPPRYLELLELVTHNDNDQNSVREIIDFCQRKLGKEIVMCNDTPGFIANRIGCYFLELGLNLAIKYDISIEEADYICAKYFGMPKTGIFGLWDLIGIDLMPLIAKSMVDYLNPSDPFVEVANSRPDIIEHMLSNGLKGKKSKSGFYKIEKLNNGKKQTYCFNLVSKKYIDAKNVSEKFNNIKNLKELIASEDNIGKFSRDLMVKTLNYAASLVPEATTFTADIDRAMRAGYNWKYGPFELIDMLGDRDISGAKWLVLQAGYEKIEPADILTKFNKQYFYEKEESKLTKYYIYQNKSISIQDIGDNIAKIELLNKMGVLDHDVFDTFENLSHIAKNNNIKGFVITGTNNNFCAGANLNYMLEVIESGNEENIRNFISHGQKAMKALKNLNVPIVAAVLGVALGGGTEILLHCHGIQVHSESKIGLVESKIGLIPGWGGCKQSIINCFNKVDLAPLKEHLAKAYSNILNAYMSSCAIDAIENNLILHSNTRISMNKSYVIDDAKAYVLDLAESKKFYIENQNFNYENTELEEAIKSISDKSSEIGISKELKEIFLNNREFNYTEEKLLNLEKEIFIKLSKDKTVCDKIKSVILNKK